MKTVKLIFKNSYFPRKTNLHSQKKFWDLLSYTFFIKTKWNANISSLDNDRFTIAFDDTYDKYVLKALNDISDYLDSEGVDVIIDYKGEEYIIRPAPYNAGELCIDVFNNIVEVIDCKNGILSYKTLGKVNYPFTFKRNAAPKNLQRL